MDIQVSFNLKIDSLKDKVNLDWGLGQLSPKKQSRVFESSDSFMRAKQKLEEQYATIEDKYRREQRQQKQKVNKSSKKNQKKLIQKKQLPKKDKKQKTLNQAMKILTESSDKDISDSEEQNRQQLQKILKEYSNKKKRQKLQRRLRQLQQKDNKKYSSSNENRKTQYQGCTNHNNNSNKLIQSRLIGSNKKMSAKNSHNSNMYYRNVMNDFKHGAGRKQRDQYSFSNDNENKYENRYENRLSRNKGRNSAATIKQQQDYDSAKHMRFLENSLLPERNKHDQMTAILDFDLNSKLGKNNNSMSDSRVSGKSHFANKLGDGYNQFRPMKQKVKEMNEKLKEMYDYDQICRNRQVSQIQMG